MAGKKDNANKGKGVKVLDTKLDPKQREVKLTTDGKVFTVSKENLNEPVLETHKTEKEARKSFKDHAESTQN